MSRRSNFGRLLAAVTALGFVVATAAGCSSSSSNASCVGIMTLHGNRYYPWVGTHPVKITAKTIRAKLPNCHDTPYDNGPGELIKVHKIKGIHVHDAVAEGLIPKGPHAGSRVIYIRAAPMGRLNRVPEVVRGLVSAR